MSNNNDDPFFKLLKNTYSYNKEPGDKRSLADLYSNFKETNNRYQQQNLNSFIRKPGNNGVNLNNYAFRTEYRPHDNMKLEFYERADPNYVEEEDRAHDNPFGDRSDTEIMTEDIEDVDEDEEQQDEQEEEMELEEEHKEEQKPGGVVPDVTVSPLKANQNHLQSFAYQKGKTRQPTLKELLSKTGKIKKKDGADAENGKKMNKGEAKTAPPPKPKEPTKEERMEMLKNELKKKAMVEKEQQRKNAFEAEEARKKIAMQAKQKEKMMKEYRQKMKDDEQARLASLLKSNGQILGNNVKDLNQAINKQRKNTDPLIKFFLAYKYFDPEGFALPTYPIGNEFEDYLAYQQAFQPMIMNEYIANIKSSLQPIVRQSSNTKSVRCMMRIHNTSGNEEDDYTIIELKESKSKDDNDQILSFQNKNINEVFDLSFANNYLILITSTKTIVKEQINSDDYKKGFAFVGYISSEGKSNIMETPKAFIIANYPKLKKYLKSEWASCYVRPIEKITTFLREYISLNCFVYSDVNQYVFRPREVSNIIDFDHTELYEKFFNSIRPKYNQGQMDSIQDVCLSRNGICLLQGPPGTGKTHTLLGIVSGIYHYLKSSQTTHRQYIMICTPSNTAIDEIILRLKQHGLYNENGEIIKPNVVRVGILDKDPHELVKQCALENLAQKEMLRLSGASNPREEATMNELRDEIAKLSKKIEVLRLDPEGDKQELKGLYEKRRALHSQYHDHKTMQVGEKERYSQVVQNILYSADIICCTLTSAGSEKLERFRDYVEAVIVDEASQCTEPSNIIPLQYSPKKLILIGDPKQLPATTFSNDSHVTRFNRSLFERVIDCGVKPFFLYEQYRMISNIRKFPSYYFYEDRLTDAPSVLARKFPPYLANLETRNVLFLDLKFSREVSSDKSYYNSSEIAMAMGILEFLIKKLTASNQSTKHLLGCITPYKKQVIALNEKLRDKYGMKYRDHVTVNTVDAFQGQEKDVILFSTVRASAHAGESDDHNLIGFLSDVRRLNVAITRPKFVLIVIGNSNTLATNETWRSYIEHLIKNKCYVNVPEASEIDKVIRILFRGDKIPDHLTKPPDLPKVTPKRTKKEPSVHTISSGEGNADQPKSRRSENDSKEGSAKPIRRQLSKKGSFSKPKRKQDEEEEKDEKQNESLLSEGDMEKIHKKVKPHEEVPNLRREDKSTVASKGSATTMSTEPSFGGLGSLFGGSAGGADQKKKQEDAGAGLSSLFSGGSTKPKKKEPEDNSHSILNRLFNI